jgi:pyruvate dehydrogenase E1 component alpha subunit
VLFVCEDNGFAATTRTAALTGGPGPAARAESLGIPAVEVDGNDVLAVDAIAGALIARLRRGEGPQFLVARTYRLAGHTAADQAAYRPQSEVEERWAQDPLARCGSLLLEAGVAGDTIEALRQAAIEEAAQAVATARAAPWPDPAHAALDVQDVGAPAMAQARG